MQLLRCRRCETSYAAGQVVVQERAGILVYICPTCRTTPGSIDLAAEHAVVEERLRLREETAANSAAARVEETVRLAMQTTERVQALLAHKLVAGRVGRN